MSRKPNMPNMNRMQTRTISCSFAKDFKAPESEKIRETFDGIAEKYDLANVLCSFGLSAYWTRSAARAVIDSASCKTKQQKSCEKQPLKILDLACGTGQVSYALASLGAKVVGSDFSEGMLNKAKNRLNKKSAFERKSLKKMRYAPEFVCANAENLPFEDNSFDAAVTAYGLRNMKNRIQALKELKRVIKPGGTAVILDFDNPQNNFLRSLYRAYNRIVLPSSGMIIANNKEAYAYLAHSISTWGGRKEVCSLLHGAGFKQIESRTETFGAVSICRAKAPEKTDDYCSNANYHKRTGNKK